MAEVVELRAAIAELVRDGDAVAMEGFTHLIPFAAGHEVLRQGRRELELIRMTPDLLYLRDVLSMVQEEPLIPPQAVGEAGG